MDLESALHDRAAAALEESGGDAAAALTCFARWVEDDPDVRKQYIAWGCATGWWTAETWGRENGMWEAGMRHLLATAVAA